MGEPIVTTTEKRATSEASDLAAFRLEAAGERYVDMAARRGRHPGANRSMNGISTTFVQTTISKS
jgi:hypothetical protein